MQASKLIFEAELDDAEKILQQLMPHTEGKEKNILVNNLATIEYVRGNIEQALTLLTPYLDPSIAFKSPYTLGLAAQLHARLHQRNEAERCLNRAVQVFERMLPCTWDEGIEPLTWYEYTVQLMRAAGALGDHHRV